MNHRYIAITCFKMFVLIVPATGWVSHGAAVSVPGLAHVQRHARVQALFSQTHQAGGQVAGGVWWRRGSYCGTLSVSIFFVFISTAQTFFKPGSWWVLTVFGTRLILVGLLGYIADLLPLFKALSRLYYFFKKTEWKSLLVMSWWSSFDWLVIILCVIHYS